MRSPLEHEPDLISGVGLITVRWAVLEDALSNLFGRTLKIEPAGEQAYYAIGNFSQRVDLIEAALIGSFRDDLPKRVTRKIFEQIRRLWKTRNRLVHSHYVYAEVDWEGNHIGSLVGIGMGPNLGTHPKEWAGKPVIVTGPDGIEMPQPRTSAHGFAYVTHTKSGEVKYSLVNRSTFEGHAAKVSQSARRIAKLDRAISTMDAPLRHGSFWRGPPAKYSQRAARNQKRYQDYLDRKL